VDDRRRPDGARSIAQKCGFTISAFDQMDNAALVLSKRARENQTREAGA
jgi:hypothetical protein